MLDLETRFDATSSSVTESEFQAQATNIPDNGPPDDGFRVSCNRINLVDSVEAYVPALHHIGFDGRPIPYLTPPPIVGFTIPDHPGASKIPDRSAKPVAEHEEYGEAIKYLRLPWKCAWKSDAQDGNSDPKKKERISGIALCNRSHKARAWVTSPLLPSDYEGGTPANATVLPPK
ncbi:hypothetical protein FA13DRAFT_1907326 [Coprinellus micaceus]|uniref:Uncharacterized protein n=1 Tax=Coprinellus micaceus TaxID=71717 RepID=A0A4Y7SSC9_COPMI|nr:hypothetical protein FA13DRAFT_1907326 [Coprinellus micaceus]